MKHLVDIDERALQNAQESLGTPTIKATVNMALYLAGGQDVEARDVESGLNVLASFDFEDRADAWR